MVTNQEQAMIFAINAHKGQFYGNYPYIFHLLDVKNIACALGADQHVLIACLLHDILEDTDMSYNDISDLFSNEVADIVLCVTDEPGKNRRERKAKTYPKIRANWQATFIKICDRVANIKHCQKEGNVSLLKMYQKEHNHFVKELKDNSHPKIVQRAWELLFKTLSV